MPHPGLDSCGMTLAEQLRMIRLEFEGSGIEPEKLRVLDDHVEHLRGVAPGVRDAILGATAPDFELSCSAGTSVRLAGELAKGPVVLSWYRGSW